MNKAVAFAPYSARRIRFHHLHTSRGHTLKVYTITINEIPIASEVIDAALAVSHAYLTLPRAPQVVGNVNWTALDEYGTGSLVVHRGREAYFAVLDWWTGENMLRHHVWTAPLAPPHTFESLDKSDLAMCVWELAVIQHERSAWLRHVLTPEGRADVAAYEADVLNADI